MRTRKGVRPLGRGIEFGEAVKDPVDHEFREELGITVTVLGEPTVFENIYSHERARGNKLLVLFDVSFADGQFEADDVIVFHDDNGDECVARWDEIDQLDLNCGPEIYPADLKAQMKSFGVR